MITPSATRNYSITVGLHQPLIKGGAYIRTLENELNSYSHTISVNGGFISASISISSMDIDDWILNGLGRHIVAYGSGGEIIWEGFIDNVSVNLGNITIERGRLTELCNRCMITYTPVIIDLDTGQEESGDTTQTTVADDEDSIEKYGIWEQVVSGGSIVGVGEDEEEMVADYFAKADAMRDLYLKEHKEPEVSHNPVVGNEGGDISITLDCKGYIEWFTYVYNYGELDEDLEEPIESIMLSDKITEVLNAEPNGIFPTAGTFIAFNGLLVNRIEMKDRTAKTILDECLTFGDIDLNRWTFGIYEERNAYYKKFSTEIDYLYYIASNMQKIIDRKNTEILPWNVRPGKVAFLPDTVLGGSSPVDIYSDARIMFIEEVSFTAPDTINLTGKKVKTFDQLQAQLGLA